jgi:hypothetical protein
MWIWPVPSTATLTSPLPPREPHQYRARKILPMAVAPAHCRSTTALRPEVPLLHPASRLLRPSSTGWRPCRIHQGGAAGAVAVLAPGLPRSAYSRQWLTTNHLAQVWAPASALAFSPYRTAHVRSPTSSSGQCPTTCLRQHLQPRSGTSAPQEYRSAAGWLRSSLRRHSPMRSPSVSRRISQLTPVRSASIDGGEVRPAALTTARLHAMALPTRPIIGGRVWQRDAISHTELVPERTGSAQPSPPSLSAHGTPSHTRVGQSLPLPSRATLSDRGALAASMRGEERHTWVVEGKHTNTISVPSTHSPATPQPSSCSTIDASALEVGSRCSTLQLG